MKLQNQQMTAGGFGSNVINLNYKGQFFPIGKEQKKIVKCLKDACHEMIRSLDSCLFIIQYFRKQGQCETMIKN